MSDFLIFFDESNKLDQSGKQYSYYGAYGATKEVIERVNQNAEDIFQRLNTQSELHFQEYTMIII